MQSHAQAQALGELWRVAGGEEARTEPACPLAGGVGNAGPLAASSSSALHSREPEFGRCQPRPFLEELVMLWGKVPWGMEMDEPLEIQKFRVREYQ